MMNRFYIMLCFIASFFVSCSNNEVIEPQEVTFNVDYTFVESGNMTRVVNSNEEYTKFYNDYIKTKILTPKNYTLTFKQKDNASKVTINGLWEKKDGIRLIEGEYIVTGTSYPLDSPSDTVFIKFDETVTITKDMETLNLTAKYDSWLLMFDVDNISEIYQTCKGNSEHYKHNLRKNNVYTIFNSKKTCYNHSYSGATSENIICIKRNDGKEIKVEFCLFNFEKGKYYYFNDITNTFDIPPMENGN